VEHRGLTVAAFGNMTTLAGVDIEKVSSKMPEKKERSLQKTARTRIGSADDLLICVPLLHSARYYTSLACGDELVDRPRQIAK
jgi:hypothetical protein